MTEPKDKYKCPRCGGAVRSIKHYVATYECGSRETPTYFEKSLLCSHNVLQAECASLRAIVAKLPTTADGVPVVPGMTLYSSQFICGHFRHPETVISLSAQADPDQSGWADGELDEGTLYSTREAAEQAAPTETCYICREAIALNDIMRCEACGKPVCAGCEQGYVCDVCRAAAAQAEKEKTND